MSIVDVILSFDGKHVDELKLAVKNGISGAEWHQVATYFSHPDTRLQASATWLVKTALEQSKPVPSDVVDSLLSNSALLTGWEAKLHLLQSIQFLDIDDAQTQNVRGFIKSCEASSKTLLRVWALDAFVRLNCNDEIGVDIAKGKTQSALKDDAASMRARARNLCNEFPQLAKI
ncbi:hypothetical protein [Maritalea sp.]|uniref:hypothetical protein n=1 Tax=Maritalea sp. TaxID=2003361 RepID=UPI003EF2131B